MKFVVIVGLTLGILVENESICLIKAEEWLDGIIVRSDYIIMQLYIMLKPYLLCQHYA